MHVLWDDSDGAIVEGGAGGFADVGRYGRQISSAGEDADAVIDSRAQGRAYSTDDDKREWVG